MGAFPYGKWSTIFEQLNAVVSGPAPQLPADSPHSQELRNFVASWYVLLLPSSSCVCVCVCIVRARVMLHLSTFTTYSLRLVFSLQSHQRPSPAAQLRSTDARSLFQEVWRGTGWCWRLVQRYKISCLAKGSRDLFSLSPFTVVNQMHPVMLIEQNV